MSLGTIEALGVAVVPPCTNCSVYGITTSYVSSYSCPSRGGGLVSVTCLVKNFPPPRASFSEAIVPKAGLIVGLDP